MKVTIQWLKEYVDFSLTPEQLAEQLTDAGIEVVSVTSNPYDSDDFVLELEITANRPDLLSVIGVAREISALTGSPLKEPEIKIIESDPPVETLATVTILAPELCPRYSARVITGVKIGPSPDWLVKRLTAVGVRTINNVVDVTNYVLMEYGHPMHAFDLNCLDGHNIVVRTPYPGETLKTLDEQERLITPEMLVIADGKKPVALAGIMGGANSQVVNSTTDILLESAYFNPVSTRKTASALGLKTEASYRFERGADPEGTIPTVNRGIQLIQKLAGGRIARGIIDVYPKPIVSPTSITLRVSRTNHILGTKLELDAIQDILVRLQLSPTIIDVDTLQVRIPSFRRDISREIDLIEEIARIYGYNRIPTTTPVIHIMPYTDTYHRKTERVIRNQMISAGFYEAVNHSLVDPIEWQKLGWDSTAAISLKNPMSVEQSIVRTSLLPSLLRNLADNIKQGANEVALFELNYVYEEDTNPPQTNVPIKKSNPYRQITNLAAVLYRKLSGQSWNEPFTYPDFYYLKGVIESVLEALEIDSTRLNYHAIQRTFLHSTRAAEIKVGKQSIGLIGQLANSIAGKLDIKKETFLFELNLDAIYNLPKRQRQYQPLPKYPAVIRDVSLLVPNSVSSIQITSLIQSVVKENIAGIELFDVYSGDKIPAGFRSLSYRITYRADDRTLSDEEVNQLNQQVLQTLIETLEIKIR